MGLGDQYNEETTISEVPVIAPSTRTQTGTDTAIIIVIVVLLPGLARVLWKFTKKPLVMAGRGEIVPDY